MRDLAGSAVVGLVFGFSLSRIGFSSWDEVHHMFRFENLRMLFVFGGAVGLLGVAWPVVRRASSVPPRWSPRPIHRGTLVGSLLFGAGWALSGACPSIALVQLGEGQLAAVWTLLGIFAGNVLYAKVHERYFHWAARSCADE
jgi:uncharacterized membrane protein YedE/YeeE